MTTKTKLININRRRSAHVFFVEDSNNRQKIQDEHPNVILTSDFINFILTNQWKDIMMEDDEQEQTKKLYQGMAANDVIRYDREMAEYNNNNNTNTNSNSNRKQQQQQEDERIEEGVVAEAKDRKIAATDSSLVVVVAGNTSEEGDERRRSNNIETTAAAGAIATATATATSVAAFSFATTTTTFYEKGDDDDDEKQKLDKKRKDDRDRQRFHPKKKKKKEIVTEMMTITDKQKREEKRINARERQKLCRKNQSKESKEANKKKDAMNTLKKYHGRQKQRENLEKQKKKETKILSKQFIINDRDENRNHSNNLAVDSEKQTRAFFMPVDKNHIMNNRKCFLSDETGMLDEHKLELTRVHKKSTKVLYNKICHDDTLPDVIKNKEWSNDLEKSKDEFIKQLNCEATNYGLRTKIRDGKEVDLELIERMKSPFSLSSGHFVSEITTVLQTEEPEPKKKKITTDNHDIEKNTNYDDLTTMMQDMHVDFKFEKERNLAKPRKFDDSNDGTRLLVFFPISREGMLVEVFQQHSNEQNTQHVGKVLYIPYGYALVVREDVVHAGGMLCTKYNQGKYANPRVHYYVGYEPYTTALTSCRKTRSISKVSIDEENDYRYYDHSEKGKPQQKRFTTTYMHNPQIQNCRWDLSEHAADLGHYQFRNPMEDIL